ncbi:hypothetical protein ACF05T_32330 [Streptomyces lateritius]|uniref:Uncharacterized protein n=1 Tax=Streptomyces lateritius TaxID=67313 RepID=A0ABW6YLD6_9ACTN
MLGLDDGVWPMHERFPLLACVNVINPRDTGRQQGDLPADVRADVLSADREGMFMRGMTVTLGALAAVSVGAITAPAVATEQGSRQAPGEFLLQSWGNASCLTALGPGKSS